MTGDSSYISLRENYAYTVEAKTLHKEKCLVLSPILFTSDEYDNQTRCHLFLHEVHHFLFGENTLSYNEELFLDSQLLHATNWLFEEYYANRVSTEIVLERFDNLSEKLKSRLELLLKGTYESLIDPDVYQKKIKDIIIEMKVNISQRNELFINLANYIRNMYLMLVYHLAYADALMHHVDMQDLFSRNELVPLAVESFIELLRNEYKKGIHRLGIESIEIWKEIYRQIGIAFQSSKEEYRFLLL